MNSSGKLLVREGNIVFCVWVLHLDAEDKVRKGLGTKSENEVEREKYYK